MKKLVYTLVLVVGLISLIPSGNIHQSPVITTQSNGLGA
ncbi:hypothetical protein JOC58_000670 [Paenibacillus hunanensis]|uniref:Phr family secreted Rap phosphatase inhibitor n=1 Tax=Paenibacillus hunanensis TaxID=539262 RepID=A0ABU1IU40_9BACL|nr:hypothetical protein [Paenibacillus hunanensis]